jgi:HD-like signal output (HDOD) protein
MILSGQTELDSVMKSVFVAHVFMAKPCDTGALQKVVDRSCHLLALLDRDDLKAVLGSVEMLPAAPRTYLELTQLLARHDSTVSEVSTVIERDLALSAKILQLSNSAFFGLPRKITSIAEAVTYLGTVTLKNLALALETFSSTLRPGLSPSEMDALSTFSLRVGRIARLLSGKNKRKAEEAFLAGLLHAVGRLLPVSAESLRDFEEPYWPLLGAYLLGLWGLPHPIIEAIAYHQKPRSLPHEAFELVDLLHVSHHLAMSGPPGQVPAGLDLDHLRAVGFDDRKLDEAIASIAPCFDEESHPVSVPRKE